MVTQVLRKPHTPQAIGHSGVFGYVAVSTSANATCLGALRDGVASEKPKAVPLFWSQKWQK